MSFLKLISVQFLLLVSLVSVFLMPKYIPNLTVNSVLKHQDEKGMVFFLIVAFPLLNSFLYLFFYEVQSRKSQKYLRSAFFESISLYFLSFMNVISAYIYKVDFNILLKAVVFNVINNQLLFICNLLQWNTFKYYFSFNILLGNVFLVGLSFLDNFDLFCAKRINDILTYKSFIMKYFKNK
ncbi:hypothetical protein H311_00880 [Anncaliia algerae PRA109]|nr:hypothetical protein H311_00880 [Anncaliia algerae PRA109]